MSAAKWIGGFLGFVAAGPLGALAGYALGSLFEHGMDAVNTPDGAQDFATGGSYGYTQQSSRQREEEGQRNSFFFSLLVLTSYIIRADGRVMHSEMETARQFLLHNFGPAAQQQGDDILRKLFEQQKRLGMAQFRTAIADSCRQIGRQMPREQRLQLLSFLVAIAKADGTVVAAEEAALREVTLLMGLSVADMESMLHLSPQSGTSLEEAYKVLGVSPSATDDEVKKAYRKLALENHPDRVAALGEQVRKAAEKKFQQINAAKELVFKARGL